MKRENKNPGLENRINSKNTSEANQWLRGFPENIPGAFGVGKHEIPNASYTLVQIPSIHFNYDQAMDGDRPEESEEDPEKISKQYQLLINGQKNIYRILESLVDMGVEEVYVEGASNEKEIERGVSFIRNYDQPEYEEFRRRCFDSLERTNPNLLSQLKANEDDIYLFGGANVLAAEGRVKLLPAEDEETFLRENSRSLKEDLLEGITERGEEREDYLLNQIANQDRPYAVAVYGLAHDLVDNVNRWNQINQDKFSLIMVYPSLDRDSEED